MEKSEMNFKNLKRKTRIKKDVSKRLKNHKEIYEPIADDTIAEQASRCMDCGIAYCNNACPLGNFLPDINYLVKNQQYKKALEILLRTNNFPEFTGRLCPSFCESACTLGINYEPNTNREIELHLVEKGFENKWITPQKPAIKTGKKIAVIGSGPTGLTLAQQLIRKGHEVTVYERHNVIGGILALGIPDYKIEKNIIQRRVNQLVEEGVLFKTKINVGVDISVDDLRKDYDVICLSGGSTVPRDLDIDGRHLKGVHFAMDYLTQQNKINNGENILENEFINAKGKKVLIVGGGDTGADCLGIALRQGALEVKQIEIMPKPPETRNEEMPWPDWPNVLRTNSAHEEGGERQWGIITKYFSGEDGDLKKAHCKKLNWYKNEKGALQMEEIDQSDFVIETDLVIFALGFIHPEKKDLLEKLGVEVNERGNVKTDENKMTNVESIFAAGDMRTGQSLICKCIADGRSVAEAVDSYLKKTK